MVEHAFHEKGPPYVRWAAQMAVALQTGVPWMMCKQYDAPDPVVIIYSPLHLGGRLAINFSRHEIHLAFSCVDQHLQWDEMRGIIPGAKFTKQTMALD